MNPLDKLAVIIAGLMGKEPSDPDVLKAAVDVVMAMREPGAQMLLDGVEAWHSPKSVLLDAVLVDVWQAMIDALLTEGEG